MPSIGLSGTTLQYRRAASPLDVVLLGVQKSQDEVALHQERMVEVPLPGIVSLEAQRSLTLPPSRHFAEDDVLHAARPPPPEAPFSAFNDILTSTP